MYVSILQKVEYVQEAKKAAFLLL
jgi:hypothetical protein